MTLVRLKTRLGAGLALILAACAASAAVSLYSVGRVGGGARTIIDDALPGVYLGERARALALRNNADMKDVLLSDSAAQRQAALGEIGARTLELKQILDQSEGTFSDREGRLLLDNVRNAYQPWMAARDQILSLAARGQMAKAQELARNATASEFLRFMRTLDALNDYNKARAVLYADQVADTVAGVGRWIGAAGLLTLLLAAAIAFRLNRSISVPVAALTAHVRRVERGDLGSRCDYAGADELGELSEALNRATAELDRTRRADEERAMNDRRERETVQARVDQLLGVVGRVAGGDLRQAVEVTGDDVVGKIGDGLGRLVAQLAASVGAIARNAGTLAASSRQLSGTAEQMAANSEATSMRSASASAAADQVSRSVAVVATGADEMNASIREIAKNAHDATKVATIAVKVAEVTDATMSKLGRSSGEIGKVLKAITSIAEQTNLLALNATIEAARAGDAGRGFAVVAGEVKELAKETARATQDIGHRIETIQTDTAAALNAIREIRVIIRQVHDISTTIASGVEEQTATTKEIGRNAAEAARGTSEIAQTMVEVAQAAKHAAAGATESQASATALSQMAAELDALVAQFQLRTSAPPPAGALPERGASNGARRTDRPGRA